MEQEIKDKWAIWAPILAVIVSMLLSALISNYSRARDAVTQEQAAEMVDIKGEEILDRSKKYTDIKVEGQIKAYEKSFEHLEKMVRSNNESFMIILQGISDRLDRIDQRITELQK